MTLQQRDRRALAVLAAAALIALIVGFWPSASAPALVSSAKSAPETEKRLARVRQLAALVPGTEEALKLAAAELAGREKGLVQAETAAQAQAQLLQILRRVARGQAPPVDIRASEIGQVRALGRDYGEVVVSVSFECRIEQLLNMLADLTAQPELVATSELRVGGANEKQKTMPVRLTVSGIVPRALVPEKKGSL
jgi:hypothetical protein